MRLRYRILQCRWREGNWQNWGFFYEPDGGQPSQDAVMCHHNVNEFEWMVHDILERTQSQCLPLERVHEAVASHSDACRVLPEIRVYESESDMLSAAINAIEAQILDLDYIAPHDASEESIRVFSGTANRPLAQSVAHRLGFPLSAVTITRLPDSEIHIQLDEVVRNKEVFVIQPCSAPVNEHLVELLLMIDAFRRASARSITALMPYFPYARQERMARGREAISARVVASMLEEVGVDRVIYVDIHAEAIQGFFTVPADRLQAFPIISHYFHDKPYLKDAVVVSPDVGRARLASKYAQALGVPLVLMHKRRESFRRATATHVVGDIEDKIPILIDDIIASGSVLNQLPILFDHGARREVHIAVTHPVLLPPALEWLDEDWISELVVTDTILVPPSKRHSKLRIVSVAPMLAYAIRGIYHGESISPLWDSDAPSKLGFYESAGG
ncbi:MAG: ribose-phosphate diphosphokinase [Chloroflexi bacterium]|nr:ribose-phosphate diphosphokinase [Chloroflexota bacterium]